MRTILLIAALAAFSTSSPTFAGRADPSCTLQKETLNEDSGFASFQVNKRCGVDGATKAEAEYLRAHREFRSHTIEPRMVADHYVIVVRPALSPEIGQHCPDKGIAYRVLRDGSVKAIIGPGGSSICDR